MIDMHNKPEQDELVCKLLNLMSECDAVCIPYRHVSEAAKSLYELYENKRAWDCGTPHSTRDCKPTVSNPLGQLIEEVSLKDAR